MKVLISSRSFGKAGSNAIEILKKAGLEPILNPLGRKLSEDELIKLINNEVICIIAGTERITKKVIMHAKSLKVISRYGAGLDNIDLKTTEERGIIVRSTPEAPAQAVAELTLALILNLFRNICKANRDIRSGVWEPQIGRLLSGKTIGILGLGRIGKEVVRIVEPFNLRVLAYEKRPDKEFIAKYKIELVSLRQLISESDIISLHLPLSDETHNIIGKTELPLMKPQALLINTARGELIDEDALVDALERKAIGGVAADVFKVEPYRGRLKEFDNVVLAPHIGSYTQETRKKMEIETVKNLINALKEVNTI